MFDSTDKFNWALESVLKAINQGLPVREWQGKMSDIEFHDVLEYALRIGYMTGVKVRLGARGDFTLSVSSPRLTYEGLQYLEKHADEE